MTIRICPQCELEFDDPNRDYRCKPCISKYNSDRQANYKIYYKQLMRKLGCQACGFNHPDAIEVHHITKGSKRYSSEGKRTQGLFYNERDLDAGKAITLCANCHLLFHSHFGGRHADFPDQTKESTIAIIMAKREEG